MYTANSLTINGGNLVLNSGSTITMGASSSSAVGLVLSRVSGDTEWRFTADVDGQLAWGPGTSNLRDVWLYRGGSGQLFLSKSSRTGNDGALLLGELRVGTSSSVTNASMIVNGTISVGLSHTINSTSLNNFVLGSSNTLGSSANRCFVGGDACTVNGTSNFCYGSGAFLNTTGSYNCLIGNGTIQANGGTQSSGCAVLGSATISGCTNCFAIGARSGTLQGRSGCVIMGDNQASSFSPGSDNIFQCRFNGGGVAGNNGYWFSSDVNSNGVKLAYQGNSWGSIGSDSRLKNKLYEMDYQSMLNAIDSVPCYRYTYKHDGENASLRTGWFADEFNKAFKDYIVPQTNRQHEYSIAHPDEEPIHTYNFDDGIFVAYCGVKALRQKVSALEQTAKSQQQTIDNQQQIIDQLLARVTALEQK